MGSKMMLVCRICNLYEKPGIKKKEYKCMICNSIMEETKERIKTIKMLNHPLFGDYNIKIPLKTHHANLKALKAYITAQELLRNIKK